jgi:hypothetical protein
MHPLTSSRHYKEEKMFAKNSRGILAIFSMLLIFSLACGVSFDVGGDDEPDADTAVELTLQALYAQYTAEAASGAQNAPPEQAAAEVKAPVEIQHNLIPGNPGSPEVTHDEIDTSNTAGQKLALGDSFRLGTFERPFTTQTMDYFGENDLIEVKISKDNDFYYIVLEIYGPNKDSGILSATYGVEFDTDLDGRGDVLLYAKGGGSTEWTIEGVSVYADTNNDVGGSRPVLPDTNDGDGYDQVLFSINDLNDPDGAWQKADGDEVYLAVKRTLVGGSRFFLRAWADSGLADPAKYDFNDAFSEEQAGSATKTNALYPVNQLNLMDSTCWIAYNYAASGKELGGCYQLQPTVVVPTPPPTTVPCPSCSSSCEGKSQICCLMCPSQCAWNGQFCSTIIR